MQTESMKKWQCTMCKSYGVNCRVCLFIDAGGDSSSSNIEIDGRWRAVIQGLLSSALYSSVVQCSDQCTVQCTAYHSRTVLSAV